MSRRDYIIIAAAIKRALKDVAYGRGRLFAEGAEAGIRDAAWAIAESMLRDNAAFDQKKFMEECGFPS